MKVQKRKGKRKKVGLSPGSVVFTGNQKVEKVITHYFKYNRELLEEKKFHSHENIIFPRSNEDHVDWYDIRGLHDTSLIEMIGKTFEIHTLVLEDVVDTYERPKYDEYVNGNFIMLKALAFKFDSLEIKTEQVALFYRNGLLISFQETESDIFEAVRQRISSGRGRIRERGADYLCYSLIDVVVDNYFIVLDGIEETIENLESKLLDNPDKSIKGAIHHLKKELLVVRKSISPLREAIGRFSKSDSPFIDERTPAFIRDLYDHTIQIMDMVDTYRDMLNGLQDLYISEISLRMNQVMQILTIVTAVFVPLSFLAGLYGMNFDHMPELQYRYGYFVLLGTMAVILIGSLLFFKKKKWF